MMNSSDQQRFWSFADEKNDNLIVVDSDAIYVATLENAVLTEIVEEMKASRAVSETLQTRKIYRYEDISEVECNLRRNMVRVETKSGESVTFNSFDLHDNESRDQFLESLKDQMGEGWQNKTEHLTRLDAAGAPALALAVLVAIMGFIWFAASASEPEDGRPRVGRGGVVRWLMTVIFSLFGWTGVGCVVGLLIIVTFVWLVNRIMHPPIEWALKPTK